MKNVLILGATSGLAVNLARLMSASVESLLLVARDASKLDLVAGDLRIRGPARVETLACDFARPGGYLDVAKWLDQFNFDTVLFCHGILGDQSELDAEPVLARAMVDTNFSSFVELGTYFASRLEHTGGGQLVVFSSVAGERGKQSNAVYSSTMAARTSFADGLRHRYFKRGVFVSTLILGQFDSPMTAHMKQGRLWISGPAMAALALRAIRRRCARRFLPGFWRLVMLVIRSIPERVFLRTGL